MRFRKKKCLGIAGGFLAFLLAAWLFLPYSRQHLIEIQGSKLLSTYIVWTHLMNKDWNRRHEVIRTPHTGGIAVAHEGTFVLGERVAYEMRSERLPGVVLYVTEHGEVYLHDAGRYRPIKLQWQ